MKIVFPSVEEMIDELKERGISEVRLITTDKNEPVKYGTGEKTYSIEHHTLETLVTANLGGMLAECRIRYGSAAYFDAKHLTELREKSIEREKVIVDLLQAAGLKIRTGLYAEGNEVLIASVTK